MTRPAARLLAGRAAIATAVVLALSCCSGSDGESDEEAGALAAAQAYVDAIAARDGETADAMTDLDAFEHASGPDDDVDIRAALPDVADPISDPWVALLSTTYDAQEGPAEYVVNVSYEVRDLTGGGTITVTLEDGEDPSDVDSWTVTEPLIARGGTRSALSPARIGPVELTYGISDHQGVWGYPGGYLLEPEEETPDVDPLWVAVGAADAPPWDDSLPMLERTGSD